MITHTRLRSTRRQAAQNAVALYPALHLALLAKTGGIREHKPAVFVLHQGIDGIPRRTGLVGHDQAILAQNMVDQAGLAHIGTTDDSHSNTVIILFVFLAEVQMGTDGIQQIAGAVAMYAGNRNDFSQARE